MPTPSDEPAATDAPTPPPSEEPEETPAPTPPETTVLPEEPAPPAEAPPAGSLVTVGGRSFLADGEGGFIFPDRGLQEWDGYTYYFRGDGSIAAGEVIAVDGEEYAFDKLGRWVSPLRAALEASATASLTSQIVLVVDHELTFWEREDGVWHQRLAAFCGYGKNGLASAEERVEGSGTTPIGAFPLTLAFGTGKNPGTEMLYRQITAESYWSAAEDESYNTWVESAAAIPGEHLADYYQYVYAVNIGFNLDPVVYGRGSAIFLHVNSRDSWVTAGCVSLAEEDMLALLRMLRDGAYIIIVPDMESLAEY